MFACYRALAVAAVTSILSAPPQPTTGLVLRQALSDVTSADASAALSADGDVIAFVSMASMLPADDNSVADIYSLNRTSGTLTLETVTLHGRASNGSSLNPQLSGDGRYLVFTSMASNLTPLADDNQAQDVFLRDRRSGMTRRLSVAADGRETNGPSGSAVISGDGAVVAFIAAATNLVNQSDANGAGGDVYLVRLATSEVSRVSLDSEGRQFGVSHSPSLDATGGLLAFAAASASAPGGPTDGRPRIAVYVRDLSSAVTSCLTCASLGEDGNPPAFSPRISADGRFVVFALQSSQSRSDIAVHDRTRLRTTRITKHANARSAAPAISSDGSVIVFVSWASDLRCAGRCSHRETDENLLPDVYLFDARTERFTRLSGSGSDWWTASLAPAIDARGTTSAFSSRQPLGPEDPTADFDLYVCTPACI